jgi:hypothetical protein
MRISLAIFGSLIAGIHVLTAQTGIEWKETGNPAALHNAVMRDEGSIAVIRTAASGSFKRPQEAASTAGTSFLSTGAYRFGDWQSIGTFRYVNSEERDIPWLSVADPYRGNPYLWADTNGGDWSSHSIGVKTALGSPEWYGMVRGGLQMDYTVAQGNRRNDPRPLYRVRNVSVKPGVRLALSEDHAVAGSIQYGWRREDDEIGYYTVDFSRILRLRGLGTSDHVQVSSQERTQLSRSFEWSGEYHGTFGTLSSLLMISRRAERDTVFDGIADPDSGGSFLRRTSALSGMFRYATGIVTLSLRLRYSVSDGYGVDPVYMLTNYRLHDERSMISAGWWIGSDEERSPLGGELRCTNQRFSQKNITARTEWSVDRLLGAVTMSARTDLVAGATMTFSAAYEQPLTIDGSFASLRPTMLTPLIVRPDYDVHAAHFKQATLSLGVGFPLSSERGIMNTLSINLQYLQTKENYATGTAIGTRSNTAIRWDIHF